MPADRVRKDRKSTKIARKGHDALPRDKWPGFEITEEEIYTASGHDLDVFSRRDRLDIHRYITEEHLINYENRRVTEHWEATVIVAPKGHGKTTLGVAFAAPYYKRGWPVFHNGGPLFGRELQVEEVYGAIQKMPTNSILILDEAHVFFGVGGDSSRHARVFKHSLAALRKKNCRVLFITAAIGSLSNAVKDDLMYTVAPIKPKINYKQFDFSNENLKRRAMGLKPKGLAKKGSNLFRLGYVKQYGNPYHVNDPFLQMVGIEDEAQNFEMTEHILKPSIVRDSLMLNDSFREVAVGAQQTVNINNILEEIGKGLYEEDQEIEERMLSGSHEPIVDYGEQFFDRLDDLEAYIATHKIGPDSGCISAKKIGEAVGMNISSWELVPAIEAELGLIREQKGFRIRDLKKALNDTKIDNLELSHA